MKGLFSELSYALKMTTVFCNTQNVIYHAKDQMFHEKTKHIDT